MCWLSACLGADLRQAKSPPVTPKAREVQPTGPAEFEYSPRPGSRPIEAKSSQELFPQVHRAGRQAGATKRPASPLCCWVSTSPSPFLCVGSYIKDYPQLFDPRQGRGVGAPAPVDPGAQGPRGSSKHRAACACPHVSWKSEGLVSGYIITTGAISSSSSRGSRRGGAHTSPRVAS